ncbi:uncharacterized protein PRCAT00001309001 [Priceomyces carsonii]|uniref:uncharacterized protein n=1 Tax=Priceomyces carsonii TaxID=28549 RepID=UPI002EDA1C2E|nr:unnamed protein product [Priceomyces carsonii]
MKILSIKLKKRKTENIKVEIVFNEVLKKLSKQKKISLSNSLVPSYIGSTHLRDLILSNEKNLTAKMNFWNKVTKKVEYNSNVRSKLIENHGEIMKVWEWISDIDIDN